MEEQIELTQQEAKMYNNGPDRPVNEITIETEKDHYGTVTP